MLMSKSSESIWRATRSNVEGIPPLPDDLSEPQYAHLLFSQYCDVGLERILSVFKPAETPISSA